MAVSRQQIVVDLDGVRGSIQEFAEASDGRRVARIELETGASVSVSSDLLHLEEDGGYSIPERWPQVVRESATGLELPVVQEDASIAVRHMQHHVRVRRKVVTEQRTLETPVWTEDVQIERIPRDEFVQHMPEARQDGDALVIPVIEQVAVVENRLRLREEIRIRVVRREHVDRRTIAVRRHEVEIDRQGETPASPAHSNLDDKGELP